MVVDANVSIGGLSFAQLILDALYGYGKVMAQPMMTDAECRHRVVSLTADDLYALPPNAAEMLDGYFTGLHELTPMFHHPSARRIFGEVLDRPAEDRHRHSSVLALLNMIFALVTSLWESDVDANTGRARRHYDIAMALLQPSLLRDCRLDHVQALLLGARYLQTSNSGEECWNVLGLAIRVAYGLRLHQDPPSSDPPPLRETKRRVWYAAYILDMHWSMIYQRPPATRSSDHSVSLPEDLDDECIREDGILRPMPSRPSIMSFSIEMIKLYKVVEIALSRISEKTGSIREVAELVMGLDDEWQKWHRYLPANLALDYDNPQEKHWILALRGNMVRILIHRQSFSAVLSRTRTSQRNEQSLAGQTLQRSQRTCVDAAVESVDIVALRYEQTKHKGLNWFTVYYCKFAGAIPVLYHRIVFSLVNSV